MDSKKRARLIIGEVLNLALNRHIQLLSDAGYLRATSQKPVLKLKQDLIDEMCKRFEPAIADYLDYPREQLWPVHDEPAVAAQIRQNFPDGKL